MPTSTGRNIIQEVIAAFESAELLGIVRASFDGLSAHLWEFSLDLRLQGETPHRNGSLIEGDLHGIGAKRRSYLVKSQRDVRSDNSQTIVFSGGRLRSGFGRATLDRPFARRFGDGGDRTGKSMGRVDAAGVETRPTLPADDLKPVMHSA